MEAVIVLAVGIFLFVTSPFAIPIGVLWVVDRFKKNKGES